MGEKIMIYKFYGFTIILKRSNNKMIYRYKNVIRPEEISFKNNEKYIAEYHDGDTLALSKLINANSKLVQSFVNRYSRYLGPGLSEEDLVQAGYVGLIKAAKRYDNDRDTKFSTYACWWIRKEILSEKDHINSTIRVPERKAAAIRSINALRSQSVELFGKVNVDWICQKAEIDEKEYYRLSQVNQEKLRIMSLNHLISDNGEDQLADILPDTRQSLQAIVDNDFLREDLHKQLHHRLTEREAKVIIERFDLDCQGQRTLQEIGQEMGVTKERIRQIEKQAINKLRDIVGLRDYFLNN